jgi:hypothetical protein
MGIGESNGDRVRRSGLWIRLTRDTGILYLNIDHSESLTSRVTIFGAQLKSLGTIFFFLRILGTELSSNPIDLQTHDS